MKYRYLLYTFCLFSVFSSDIWAQQVEVKNGYFYIDEEKFFIKGIGFEVGALPGNVPWVKTFDADQLHFDIQRILSGGFNTIRTWAPFSEEELDLLQAYDIKIIMGIWIDPHADFSNQSFVNEAKSIVSNVLSYSKNYDNIIAYLIMNEPLPETIFNAGYDETVDLWTELINLIHAQHPNRPVSIANTSNGTYIDSDIFDFSAYNAYIYNPVTVNYLHGYLEFTRYLKKLISPGQPLVITEYGLSVSPSGPGNWDYGGNSLTEQQEGILHMYKSLVDGGASGSCVFNYSDGWWKSGNEFAHDDAAEEWFGLVEYISLTDTEGSERPVWNAVKDYQSAIITQPQSSEIYINEIPVEIFINDTIDRIDILQDNSQVYQKQISSNYLLDTLLLDIQEKEDVILVFNCYNIEDSLIKSEEKSILIINSEITLPTIQITTNADFWQTNNLNVSYQINKSADFTTDTELNYIYYPHIGFSYGQKFQVPMPEGDPASLSRQYSILPSVPVFTVGAAFDISFNSFRKRIVNQVTHARPAEVLSVKNHDLSSLASIQIFPNPATDFIRITCNKSITSPEFDYVIYNSAGSEVRNNTKTRWNEPIETGRLIPGVYHIRICTESQNIPFNKKFTVL